MMLRKWLRFFHTVRYIKTIQFRYQIWYRIKNRFISIHWYKEYLNQSINSITLHTDRILYTQQREFLGDNTFCFINLTKKFSDRIYWNYQENGKLWNYNLQYFNYLLDEDASKEERLLLLKDFSQQLLNANIKLEPYPVSLRIVNTLLFHSRYPIVDSIIVEALKKQINYLSKNLELHLLANHLLENAFSLFFASLYLGNSALYTKSFQLLSEQLDEQVLADGGHYECSPMYQSILLSKLFLCVEVARKSKLVKNTEIILLENKAAQMLGWINTYSFPDKSWALFNDAAEQIAPTTDSLNEAAKHLNIKPLQSMLSISGFRKLIGHDWELIVKTGAVQPTYQPGHVHADVSSFCLWYKGNHIVVDPGISTYAISVQRNQERGTASHNTININQQNQSDIWGGFRVGKRAIVALVNDTEDYIEIHLHPYFNRRIKHIRSFRKINENRFVIEDRLQYDLKHKYISRGGVQFAATIGVNYHNNLLKLDGITINASGIDTASVVDRLYAVTYNHFLRAPRFEYIASLSSSLSFSFS